VQFHTQQHQAKFAISGCDK